MSMRPESALRPAQLGMSDYIRGGDYSLLLVDPGGGKTAGTLTPLAAEGDFPALVLGPLNVIHSTWMQEAAEWSHLCDLTFSKVTGDRETRARALEATADIYLLNYENLPWLIEQPEWKGRAWRAIVLDEITFLKGRGTWWKSIYKDVRKIPVRVGLTGTFRGNSYVNLWAQCRLLDTNDYLETGITKYKQKYLYPTDYNQQTWAILPGQLEPLAEQLAKFTYVMPDDEYPDKPGSDHDDITIELPKDVMTRYNDMARNLSFGMPDDGDVILAPNQATAVNKLRQIAAGDIYDKTKKPREIGAYKTDAVAELVYQLDGDPLLLFYEFKFQEAAIKHRFPDMASLSPRNIERWNNRELVGLYAHPLSAAHGLNLQRGGAHGAFMSIPWSSDQYRQGSDRLDRPGQQRRVTIHRFLSRDTKDEEVAERVHIHQNHEAELKQAILNAQGVTK